MSRTEDKNTFAGLERPTIFAHRGSSAYAPENTLAAFKLAIDQHADGIELDAKLSADGHVVVMHDETVNRTTNGSGAVRSLALSDLKSLDAGVKLPPKFSPEKIPTLEEVFSTVGRKICINVELTNYSSPADDLPDKVISLVRKYNLEKHVLLSSFNMIALIRARNLLPDIPVGLLTFVGRAVETLRLKMIRFNQLFALHSSYQDITSELINLARPMKCRIHVYTVNQADIMKNLFSLGVDGIFTDDPPLALKTLAEHRAGNT